MKSEPEQKIQEGMTMVLPVLKLAGCLALAFQRAA